MKINIAYIISLVHKANIFEWTAEELNPDKFKQVYVLMHSKETEFEISLRKKGFTVYRIHYSGKRDMVKTIFSIFRILQKEKINIVHTHLFDAGIAGMMAAWLKRIPKRIHTRHDATVNLDYYPQAVKWDKLTSRLATDVIAITESVKGILMNMENVPEKKISVIHHGFRLEQFVAPNPTAQKNLQEKYFSSGKPFPVIGVISRYMHWKGIEYTIDAFLELRKTFPSAHLLLANASGPYESEIHKHLDFLPKNSFTEIPFESDIFSLYQLLDVFVHVPIDEKAEAFGQIYVEAMAAGIPSIVTLSGIAHNFIKDHEHALIVPYKNSEAILQAMKELIANQELRNKLVIKARETVSNEFSIHQHVQKLEALYLKK
ncbi:MAG: glycosyltransferase family 4 protein [Bacteroidetes bacterium]|nr:glycosyltransferase family 4 protein [Bacteroidota bacterium]